MRFTLLILFFSLFNAFKVNAQCSVSITPPGSTTICLGDAATLDASGGLSSSWVWTSSPAGLNTTVSTVTASPTSTTTYTVTGTCPDGTTATANITIEVLDLDVSAVSNLLVCQGDPINLTSTVTGNGSNPISYAWTGPNGYSSTSSSPNIANSTTAMAGNYTVMVTVGTCQTQDVVNVQVNPSPVASFTSSPSTPCSNVPVTFSNTSVGSGLTYTWNFGDPSSGASNTSTLTNPSHTFSSAIGNGNQIFTITLTVINLFGCSNTISQNITVKQRPDASIADYLTTLYPPFTNCAGGTFSLEVTNISTTFTSNASYNINWGDGTSDFVTTNWVLNEITTHTYNLPGYFTLTLTVIGQNGCASTKSYVVFNGSNPSVSFPNPGTTTSHCVPYSLTIPINGTSGNPPGTIYTISTNTGAPFVIYNHPPPANYTFNFINSSCGASANGSGIPNSFYINCQAENPCGVSPQPVYPITTSVSPIARISISPDTLACVNSILTFTNTSIAGATVNAFGVCDTVSKRNWLISPASGWSITSGALGNANPNNNPSTWGSNSLGVRYTIPGTYSVSMIVSNNCGNDTIVRVVCIQSPPIPSFTINTNTGCIPLNVNATNTSNILGSCFAATYNWTVTYAAANCGTNSSWNFTNGTNASSINPSFVFNNSGTYTIILAVTNKCGTFNINRTVSVKKPPVVTLSTSPSSSCTNPASTTPTVTVTNCGNSSLSYLWTFAGGTPATSTSQNPGSVSFTGVGPHAISVAVTNECGTTNANTTFTINTTPTVAAESNLVLCPGTSVLANTFVSTPVGATFTWTNSNTAIGLAASGSTSIPSFTATNSSSSPITATISISPTIGGCLGTPINYTITVNPLNTITSGINRIVCINAAMQNITLVTTGATGVNFSGLPAGVTGSWVGNVVTITGTPAVNGTFNYTVTTTGGCPPAMTTGTITVTPLNTIATGANRTLCINSAIAPISMVTTGATGVTFSGLPVGVTGSWVGNVATISGTPTVAGTFNYTVTTTGGCPPALATGIITVTPFNTIAVGTSQSVCINSAIVPISMATTGATGATFSGLPAGVAGSWAGSVVTISGTPTVSGTFNYTVTTTGGCPPATTSGIITVTPLNTIATGTSQTVCINFAIAPISLTTTGATNVTFSGLPAGVTGSWAGNVATISGTPTAVGTFSYTITTTGGCPPAATTGTITVTSLHTIAAGTSQSVCINSAIAPISMATTGATGATFSGLPAGVTGSWTGNLATISGTPTVAGTFNYTVTTAGGCPPVTTTGTITVTPLNTIAAGTSQSVCINSVIVPISMVTTGATGATFSGLPAGVTGSWAGNVVTISGTPSTSGTFNYTVTTTGGCPPATTTGTITVNPLPVVNAGTNITLCNQAIPHTLTGYSPSTGGLWIGQGVTSGGIFTPNGIGNFVLTYSFTNSNSCVNSDTMIVTVINAQIANAGTGFSVCVNAPIYTLTGFTPSGGSWMGAGITGNSFNPTNAGAGTHVLTYSFGSGTCLSSDTIIATVNPLPTITTSPNVSICIFDSTQLNASATGGIVYTWSPTSGLSNPNISNPMASPATTTTYSVTVTNVNGCVNTKNITVTVNPLPIVEAGNNLNLCNSGGTITQTLTGFSPTTNGTGIWSGANVSSTGVYSPNSTGTFTLIYTFINSNSCVNSDSIQVSVINPTQANAGFDFDTCISAGLVNLQNNQTPTPIGGTWTGPGVSGINFNPITATAGNHILTYTVGTGTCLTADSIVATVNPLPTITTSPNVSICIFDSTQLNASAAGGIVYTWSPTTGLSNPNISNPMASPATTTTYTVTVTNVNGCVNTKNITVTVNPLPLVEAGSNLNLCNSGGTITQTLTGFSPTTNGTGIWSGANVSPTGVYSPNVTGTFTLTYTFTDANSCVNTDTIQVLVVDPIQANAGFDFDTCIDAGLVNLQSNQNPSPVGGTWTGLGVSGIIFNPLIALAGNYTLTYSFGTGTCLTSDSIVATVNPLPTIVTSPNVSICIFDSTQLTSNGGVDYSWSPTTGLSNPNISNPKASPNITTSYVVTVVDINGCENTASITVTVNPLPVVNAGNDVTVCNQPITETLIGFSSSIGGIGVWSGPNITSSGDFTPNGLGVFTLTFTYTDINTCINSDSIQVTVTDPALVDAGPDFSVCISVDSIELFSNQSPSPLGGIWSSGMGVSTSVLNPSLLPPGNHEIYYSVGSGTCLVIDTVIVTINPLPSVTLIPNAELCIGDSVQIFVGGGVEYYWTPSTYISNDSISNPFVFPVSSTSYNIEVTDANLCTNNG